MLKAQITQSQAQKSGADKEKVSEEGLLTARTGAGLPDDAHSMEEFHLQYKKGCASSAGLKSPFSFPPCSISFHQNTAF